MVFAAWSTPFLTVPLGSIWKQSCPLEMRVCHSTMGCKTLKSLNKLDFTLRYSPCRLCTNFYLSSHHTFAWEWLASPPGSFDMEPLLYKHPHLHYPCAFLSSGLAVPSVPAIRTRPEVLQCGCTIQARNSAKPRHEQRCWMRKSPSSLAALIPTPKPSLGLHVPY